MKEFDEVTDRLTTELNFLTEEGKQSIVIAEAALNAAMVFTIAIAPTPLLGDTDDNKSITYCIVCSS